MSRPVEKLHDHYFREAKRQGYLSRAAYKLAEIDDRKKLMSKKSRVLDCGAAPGSWLQVVLQRLGPTGRAVGIDLKAIPHQFHDHRVHVIEGDLRETPAADLLAPLSDDGSRRFDVVLSDMAPNTTGQSDVDHHASVRLCELVLDLCATLMRPGGNLAMKVFEGETYPALLQRSRGLFDTVKGFVPKASRSESREIYIVGHGYRRAEQGSDVATEVPAPPRPTPPPGWAR